MKHYDYMEWFFYKEKNISDEKYREMEEHLYNCDECMNTFLSLIDNEEIDQAEEAISSDFTKNVIGNIQKVKYKPKPKIHYEATSFMSGFGYYVAAAAVVIMLTWSGFFSGLVDVVPKIAETTIEEDITEKPNIIFSLSEKIVNRTSSFINDFEIYNGKEE
ncbi:hypothetical protein [Anaerosalibacter sp. Marseille-P3206]|uniref:hypothetical protein n=1 Tax=Anaerosalibacter sp. Marseille-P3206 TaxID=1871005 RepID=UPI000986DE8B|nr:hypothetical protein [Anaerosalibacter sp. Marseille-P3206]